MEDKIRSSLLDAFNQMDENEFTKKIIKPLFEALGYQWSQFNGGAYEEGVDLFAFKIHEITEELFVACIQSKKIDSSKKTKPRSELSDTIHQLRQCLMNPQRLPNGQNQRANEAYLAIPGEIHPRLRNEIFSQLQYGERKVDLLEGPKIIDILQKKAPHILESLMQHPARLKLRNDFLDGNKPLHDALYSENLKNITDFYCDLEFFIGQKLERSLIVSGFDELKAPLNINDHEISWFERTNEKFIAELGISFLDTDLVTAKEKYAEELEDFNSRAAQDTLKKYETAQNSLQSHIDTLTGKVTDSLYRKTITKDEADELFEVIEKWKSLDKTNLKNDNALPRIIGGEKIQKSIIRDISSILVLQNILPKSPELRVKVSIKFIEECLINRVEEHLKTVKEIEDGKGDKAKVWQFLNKAEELLELQNSLFFPGSPIFSHIVPAKFFSIDNKITFPPSLIFDSGKDIVLLGGAGFGKTTTMQSYASKCQVQPDKGSIFIELAKHKDSFKKFIQSSDVSDMELETYEEDKEKDSATANSDALLKGILDSFKCDTSPQSIIELSKVLEKTPLLLDGVDEIYSYIPTILKVIKDFKKKNSKCQIIMSTRDNTEYLSQIDFLGISLLPFTEVKLKNFIYTWLDDEDLSAKLWQTIKKKKIQDLVCNPLLATIACSLIQQGVKIPSSESKLYEKRIELLTGVYDHHRGIKRHQSSPELLKEVAKQIAFLLHDKQLRSAPVNLIKEEAIEAMKGKYNDKAIEVAIRELINPCNILILDDITNRVSFGHFRYQESLVAQVLGERQSYELLSYLHLTFWRGAFVLLAERNAIEGVLQECLRTDHYSDSYDETIEAMIHNTPENKSRLAGYRELAAMLKSSHSSILIDDY